MSCWTVGRDEVLAVAEQLADGSTQATWSQVADEIWTTIIEER